MTPRERVLAAINHQKVDRLPADIKCVSSIHTRLMERTGAVDAEELFQYFGIDMRRIGANYQISGFIQRQGRLHSHHRPSPNGRYPVGQHPVHV